MRRLPRRLQAAAVFLVALLPWSCSSDGDSPSAVSNNPIPVLTSIDPPLVVLGSATSELTLTGSGYLEGSRARLDGQDRVTTYVSGTELRMALSERDKSGGGEYTITVVNPPPGGGESGLLPVTVGYPRPTITSVSPTSATVGSAELTLSIQGTGFMDGSTRTFLTHEELASTVVSSTSISAVVPVSALDRVGDFTVVVRNPSPAGGASNAVPFSVGSPLPVIQSLAPTSVYLNTDTRISVVGEAFNSSTTLRWSGQDQPTHVVSPTILYADVPASAITSVGQGAVTLFTPAPGGGSSAPMMVSVLYPLPTITGFEPASVTAGGGGFTLTIRGTDFRRGAQVVWNGQARAATFESETALQVGVTAADVASAGSVDLAVRNPGGGDDGRTLGFPILAPSYTVTSTVSANVKNADIVVSPAGDVVYAAIPSDAAAYANSVVALDPATGAVLWSAFAGSNPQRVVVSDDGAYVYASLGGAPAVARINVAAKSKDLDIQLEDGRSGTNRVEDILVLPGHPGTIAVSLRNTCCSPRHEGVAIYDGATRRPLLTQGHTGSDRIEPSGNAGRIYGYNNETTEFGFRRILVRDDGVLQDGVFGGVIRGFGVDIVYDGGLLFSTRGDVIDPESLSVLGSLTVSGILRPDVRNGRVHTYGNGTLRAIHPLAFEELGSVSVPSANGLGVMVRFGPDGMAFGRGDRVVFVRSNLIGP